MARERLAAHAELAFKRTQATIQVSSCDLVRLEDDLHDIVDRIRASEQMIEESRRLLDRMTRLAQQTF